MDQTLFNLANTVSKIILKADGYEEIHVFGNHWEPFRNIREFECFLCGPVDENDEWDILGHNFDDFSIEVNSKTFFINGIDDYYVEEGNLYIIADLFAKGY